MDFDAVVIATRRFVRTREGLSASPTVRGFARHVEAILSLYEAFGATSWLGNVTFHLYRQMLISYMRIWVALSKLMRCWQRFWLE